MKKLIILVGIFVIGVLAFFLWWTNGGAAPDPNDSSESIFVIQKGAAIRQVGSELKEAGFIKDPVVFFLYLKQQGLDTTIHAGSYKLSPSMTLAEVVDNLQHGTIDVWITIPEGFRSEEIAEVIQESVTTYDESWVGALQEHEGYLFPDTYLVPAEASIDQIIAIMRANFDTKVAEAGLDQDAAGFDDAVIIASLIEREAITDDEKPLISSVIHNRLEDGMALDIDATLQYIRGVNAEGNWWSVPTGEERQINSPYNTYTSPGLPPTPIANPGIVAIAAALDPESSPYYFYIHDSDGDVHFARTLEEHNRNVAQYLR